MNKYISVDKQARRGWEAVYPANSFDRGYTHGFIDYTLGLNQYQKVFEHRGVVYSDGYLAGQVDARGSIELRDQKVIEE